MQCWVEAPTGYTVGWEPQGLFLGSPVAIMELPRLWNWGHQTQQIQGCGMKSHQTWSSWETAARTLVGPTGGCPRQSRRPHPRTGQLPLPDRGQCKLPLHSVPSPLPCTEKG